MTLLLHDPNINPIFLHLGPLKIRYYALAYLAGYAFILYYGRYRLRHQPDLPWQEPIYSDGLFYSMLGAIIGGRFGYMIFYNTSALIHHPLSVFYLWQGGMSFHGGLLGVIVGMLMFTKKYDYALWDWSDFIAPMVPIGLALGRFANFINGELWGRPTNQAWGMIYDFVDDVPRHPSQLYEMACEGFLLFFWMQWVKKHVRQKGGITLTFILSYALIRFVLEYFREPDVQIGPLAGGLTMGQYLSLLMILLSLGMYIFYRIKLEK